MSILFKPKKRITPIHFGALYNWYAATYNTGGASIAPIGWHMPNRAEWNTLITECGGSSVAGIHLKDAGTTYWTNSANADNSSGFTGRGGGTRSPAFGSLKTIGVWGMVEHYQKTLQGGIAYVSEYNYGPTLAFSIRLIKDDSTDPGKVTDYDGNVYATVTKGSQVWMASNLKVTHYNNGTIIPLVTDNTAWGALSTGAFCYYSNDINNA